MAPKSKGKEKETKQPAVSKEPEKQAGAPAPAAQAPDTKTVAGDNPIAKEEPTVVPDDGEAGKPEEPQQNIATGPCCRYHNEHEPRVFQKDEVIPDGWVDDQTNLSVVWSHNDYGQWSKKPKK